MVKAKPEGGYATERSDVIEWFLEYLHRTPGEEEISGRLGADPNVIRHDIRCSTEAKNYRISHNEPPDAYCIVAAPPPQPPGPGAPAPAIPGLQQLADWLNQQITQKLAEWGITVDEHSDSLFNELSKKLADWGKTVSDAEASLQRDLEAKIKELADTAGGIGGALGDALSKAIGDLIPGALALIGGALDKIAQVEKAIVDAGASLGDVIGAAEAGFGKNKDAISDFVMQAFGGAIAAGFTAFIQGNESGEIESLSRALAASGIDMQLSGRTIDLLKNMEANIGKGDMFSRLAIWAGAVFKTWEVFSDPVVSLAEQFSKSSVQVEPLPPGETADAHVKGFIDDDTARGYMARAGLGQGEQRYLEQLRWVWPPPDRVMDAQFRGIIQPDHADKILQFQGLTDVSRDIIKQTALYLPNPQDVIRFLVRDVFIPEFVKDFGMDLEQPPDAREWFAKQGITEEVQTLFWRAHWELPSLTMGFEMFQRSKINEIALRRLMRAQGVEPFWRDPLIAVAYLPITRVDVRRFHKLGLLDHAQMVRRYQDQGYSPEDAELQAQFTEKYNAGVTKDETRAVTKSWRERLINAYSSGMFDDPEIKRLLADLGEDNAAITLALNEAKILRNERRADAVTKLVKPFYVRGLWAWEQASAVLSEHQLTAGELVEVKRDWDLEKQLRDMTDEQKGQRDLSKSEYIEAYNDHIIDAGELTKHLLDLKYDADEVSIIVAIAKFKRARVEQNDLIEVVRADFEKRAIDDNTASSRLDALNVTPAHRDALIAKWTIAAKSITSRFTYGQVGDLRKADIWSDDQARAYLLFIGYHEQEISASLALWGSVAEQRKQAAEATALRKKKQAEKEKKP